MIYSILQLALINAFIIIGWYWSALFDWNSNSTHTINLKTVTTKDIDGESKMINWWIRFYSLKWFGEKWSKPIITCPVCMSSVHSIYIYWSLRPFNTCSTFVEILLYILYILLVAGIGAVLIQFQKDY